MLMWAYGIWKLIPTPYKKGLMYVGIVVGIYLGFRWWLRVHDNRVAEETKAAVQLAERELAAKEKKAALAELQKQIDMDKAVLQQEIKDKEAEIARTIGSKAFAQQAYNEQVKVAANERRLRDEQVCTIPTSQYAATVRARMLELMSSTGTSDTTGQPPNR